MTTRADELANYVFADESGKFQDKDFICLCGYLSSGDKWDAFMSRWMQLLGTIRLPAVHMKTFYADCKRVGIAEAQADEVLEQFIDIIRETILVGFAVGLDANYYRGMPNEAKQGLGDPAVACLQRLLRLIRNRLTNVGDLRLSLTLDEDETYAMKFYSVVSRLRRTDSDLGRLIGAVCFGDDTYSVPLQAADILANLTYKWFVDRMAGKVAKDELPPLLKRLQMSPEKGYGLEYRSELWDGEALRKHLSNFVKWSGFLLS
ncbi:MAG: DUF3800 domain-containing protein [Candidatus Sulfotelmatobacter sp.]